MDFLDYWNNNSLVSSLERSGGREKTSRGRGEKMKADLITLYLFSFVSGMYFSAKFGFFSADFFISLGILLMILTLGLSVGKGEG